MFVRIDFRLLQVLFELFDVCDSLRTSSNTVNLDETTADEIIDRVLTKLHNADDGYKSEGDGKLYRMEVTSF